MHDPVHYDFSPQRKHRQGSPVLRTFLVWVLLLIVLSSGIQLWAQYRYDVWTADNGLPQNIVRGIYQSPDGFLWVATFDGLVRFDGVHFEVFNKSNTSGMESNRIMGMYGEPSGDLWLISEGGGLTRYHNGSFQSFGAEQGVPTKSVRGIAGDGAGHVWILNADAIEEWNQKAGRFIDLTPADLRLEYEPLSWGTEGFWGWDERGIHCFIKGRFSNYPLPPRISRGSVLTVANEGNGVIWVETKDRKYFRIKPNHPVESVPTPTVTYVDAEGNPWTLQLSHELRRSVDDPSASQMSTIKFTAMYEDREHDLWFGTEGQGLYRLQRQSITAYTSQPGMTEDNIYPIYQDRSGAMWIGAWRMGLSRFSNGKFTAFTSADGLPGRLVTSIFEDRDGRLWVATHGGIVTLQNGHFHQHLELSFPERSVIQAMSQDQAGTLWFGTNRGLVSLKDKQTGLFTIKDGLAVDDVRVILPARSGDLWVGGYGGLSRLHNGQFSHWTEQNGLPSNNVRSLYEDSDGVLWIGTYDGGLGRFKDGAFTRFTLRDGLFNNGVFQILEDDLGNFWMSCNRGIFRASKRELNDFADGKRSSISSIAYGKVDGMASAECNGGLSPAGVKARDGKLWFPTQQGIAVVDPAAVPYNNQPPPVAVEAIVEDRKPLPFSNSIRIAPHAENIEIQYTAPSFIKSEQLHFKYRLEGFDSHWIDAGSRRTAYYSHLPPRDYSFHVIAGNSDGVWNEVGATTPFTVSPAYYQTGWFQLLCFATLALVLWGLYRLRLRQVAARMQTRMEERLSERERIARELHDTLLQGFASAYMQLDVANDLLAPDSPAKPLVQRVLNLMSQVSDEGRRAIRSLRLSDSDEISLEQALLNVPLDFALPTSIAFQVVVGGKPRVLYPGIRDEVLRIAREAILNAFRHANAGNIEVEIEYAPRRLAITVRDNGMGIDSKVLQTGREGHWGLANMRERAEEIGAKLEVLSRPGAGTEVQLEVPGKVVFETGVAEPWWGRLRKRSSAMPNTPSAGEQEEQ